MKRIAILTAANLQSDAPNRRADAWMFDVQTKILREAFAEEGLVPENVVWSREQDWGAYAAALVFCTWDYQDAAPEFLALLRRLEGLGVAVFNSRATVEWNIRKTYLRDFESWGVPTIPTLWPEAPQASDLHEAFRVFGTDDVVLKRQVGGGARAQERYAKATAPTSGPIMDRPGMIQPLIPAIVSEGEFSFLFIDGQFSHALIKRAKSGDYRIQAAYGGVSQTVEPAAADLLQAHGVLEALKGKPYADPLYARVDMVRGGDGRLMLMELEVIEPFLFPQEGPHIGSLLARALAKRLG